MGNKFKFLIMAIVLTVTNSFADTINSERISDDVIQLYNTTHNLDSIIKDCFMEITYSSESLEGNRIRKIKLLLSDTASVVQSQDSRQIVDKFYSQVTLNKLTADYFKTILFEIYSQHKSVIKDSILNENFLRITHPTSWSIKLNLPNQEIIESIKTSDYYYSFEDPFHEQFERTLDLIFAIKRKMEYDIYSLKDKDYKMKDWIKEKFDGVFYETTDIIY